MTKMELLFAFSFLSLSCGAPAELTGEKGGLGGLGSCGCADNGEKSPMGGTDGGGVMPPPMGSGKTPYLIDAETNEAIGALVSFQGPLIFSTKLNAMILLNWSTSLYYTKPDCTGTEFVPLAKQALDMVAADLPVYAGFRLQQPIYLIGHPRFTYVRVEETYPSAPFLYTWTTVLGERVCKQQSANLGGEDRLGRVTDTGIPGKLYAKANPTDKARVRIELR